MHSVLGVAMQSFQEIHRGYRTTRIIKEAFGEHAIQALVASGCYDVRRMFESSSRATVRSVVGVLTREDAKARHHPMLPLFVYSPPRVPLHAGRAAIAACGAARRHRRCAERADGNLDDAAESNPAWLPLLGTPPYPSYPGNMSAVGYSAARALERVFSTNNIAVTARWRQSSGLPDVLHTHPQFSLLADEQARSRVYGGIHYQFDSDASREMGWKIGDYVFANYMTPLQ